MKLFSFEIGGQRRLGAEWEGQLVDLPATYAAALSSSGPRSGQLRGIPSEMLSFIRLGTLALEAAREAISFIQKRPAVPVGEQLLYPLDSVKFLLPIPRPGKILCTGFNLSSPGETHFIPKLPNTLIGTGEAIIKPPATAITSSPQLGIVIGKKMKGTPLDQTMEGVFGFTILNKITALDLESHQFTLAENFDTFCPFGPCIVTADEVPSPGSLRLHTTLNGNPIVDHDSANSSLPIRESLASLSNVMTLEPGDIISVGPYPSSSPPHLQPGDLVAVEAEWIGRLENQVRAQE